MAKYKVLCGLQGNTNTAPRIIVTSDTLDKW